MAFNRKKFGVDTGAATNAVNRQWVYSDDVDDDLNAIQNLNYFRDAVNQLKKSDRINITATDGEQLVVVTSDTGAIPVTVGVIL
jgi:hypothetical protein